MSVGRCSGSGQAIAQAGKCPDAGLYPGVLCVPKGMPGHFEVFQAWHSSPSSGSPSPNAWLPYGIVVMVTAQGHVFNPQAHPAVPDLVNIIVTQVFLV